MKSHRNAGRALRQWQRACALLLMAGGVATPALADMQLNDKEYFEQRGVNVLVFSNQYNGMFFDEKTAGIELIHHGVRTATGGAIRLQNTPEQWDLVPQVVSRNVDRESGKIEVVLRYPDYSFDAKLVVTPAGDGVNIAVELDQPVPEALEGHAGLNMEFIPSAYFEKSYLADGEPGIFPLYPASNTEVRSAGEKIKQFAGHSTFDDLGHNEFIVVHPLASGSTIVLAPEDPERRVTVSAGDAKIELYDGRNLAQNGWFILRSLLPADKTGRVLEWHLEANAIPDWTREPVVQFSQVGYHPDLPKLAVVEIDPNDQPLDSMTLYRITPNGAREEVLSAKPELWDGEFYRYRYLKFDFSSVKEPGLYQLEYGDQVTNAFPIRENVYETVWHPTNDVFMAVQMDHMTVNEAYRVWHGEPYKDDALQAPTNHEHFDGYRMGPETESAYEPFERIPGLNVGGWFDAGDFDIQTGTHCRVILSLVAAWSEFGADRDQTYISQEERYVDIHRPDGKPDILQQIEHGSLALLAQVKNIGYPVRGIVVGNLHQYHHLGDAASITDNLPYNPNLKRGETDGKSSGTMDDRWVFTGRSAGLDYSAIEALAAAARALREYNPGFSKECLDAAVKLYEERLQLDAAGGGRGQRGGFGGGMGGGMNAALQLYLATGEAGYRERFESLLWPSVERGGGLSAALQAIPYLDDDFRERVRPHMANFVEQLKAVERENPYGVPFGGRGWGGNGRVVSWALTNYYAARAFPDLVGPEYAARGLNYLFGCHPYSNLSFVSAVGAASKRVAYGNNRADFSFIAGGIVPGLLVLQPDFFENKEDWPFFWGENEYVVDLGASYIHLALAVNHLLSQE